MIQMSYNNWCYCINYELLARTLHHPNILTFIGIQEKSRITILINYSNRINFRWGFIFVFFVVNQNPQQQAMI